MLRLCYDPSYQCIHIKILHEEWMFIFILGMRGKALARRQDLGLE